MTRPVPNDSAAYRARARQHHIDARRLTELRKEHGAAGITEVTRQTVGWQRQAARDLAENRFDAAVQAFDRNGAVTWMPDQDAARARWSSAGRRAARPTRKRAGSARSR